MLLLRYSKERSFVRRLHGIVCQFDKCAPFEALDLCCCECPYNFSYPFYDAEHWLREL